MSKLKFISQEDLPINHRLSEYIQKQKSDPESFLRLPFDKKNAEAIKKMANQYLTKKPASIVVVGIGGSNLGTFAVWQALGEERLIYFAETFDSRRLSRVLENFPHPANIVIVSKSGTTTETVANAAILLSKLKAGDQVTAITDENSKLWHWAKKGGFNFLATPKEIAGRYSVFSAVGLFPLALAGINIDKLLKGAKEISEECLSSEISENPAAASALAIYKNWDEGKFIHDTFLFEPDLEGVGKWYRQLTGESIGKNGKGVTPTVSIGTTDLHSVAQLYLDGPKDKFTTFVSVKDHGKDFSIPAKLGADDLVAGISGKKFSEIMAATLEGVKNAYKKQKLPFAEIQLADISEETVGAFLQMKMIEMMYLAKLMEINAFDNPAVELYKEETRKLLSKL